LADTAHYTITEVSELGEPLEPKKCANAFVKQCGVIVRDRIPITIREWHKPKNAFGVSFVDERYKESLWNELISHFTLPEFETDEDTAAMRLKVKEWALKKMAEQFRGWKKRLWLRYQKDKTAPKFEGYLEKQERHWDAFVQYKTSEEAKARSEKNKKNASKKVYHHNLGTGGYKTAMPKWEKREAAMVAKGVIPETIRDDWDLRTRNWFLGHGGEYDEQTGDLICDDGIRVPRDAVVNLMKEVKEGKFRPDREKDVLTKALGNEEHGGRTRGLGPSFPWVIGFPDDKESYRSRARAKKRQEEEEAYRLSKVERANDELQARLDRQQQQIDELRGVRRQQDPAFDSTGGPCQRKSSVASTEVPADDALMHIDARMIDGGPG